MGINKELLSVSTRDVVDKRADMIEYAKSKALEMCEDVTWRDLLPPTFFGLVHVSGDYIAGDKYDQNINDRSQGIQGSKNGVKQNSNMFKAESQQNQVGSKNVQKKTG